MNKKHLLAASVLLGVPFLLSSTAHAEETTDNTSITSEESHTPTDNVETPASSDNATEKASTEEIITQPTEAEDASTDTQADVEQETHPSPNTQDSLIQFQVEAGKTYFNIVTKPHYKVEVSFLGTPFWESQADHNGLVSFGTQSGYLHEGDIIKYRLYDTTGHKVDEGEYVVQGHPLYAAAPVLDPIKVGDSVIRGTATPNSRVLVSYRMDGRSTNHLGVAFGEIVTSDSNGRFELNLNQATLILAGPPTPAPRTLPNGALVSAYVWNSGYQGRIATILLNNTPESNQPPVTPSPGTDKPLEDSATGIMVVLPSNASASIAQIIVSDLDKVQLGERLESLRHQDADLFDIKFIDAAGNTVAVNGNSKVTMPIDAGKTVARVIYVSETNVIEDIPFTQNGNQVEFTAPHFSIYGVIYSAVSDANTKPTSPAQPNNLTTTTYEYKKLPNTGEADMFAIFSSASLMILAGLGFIVTKEEQ